MSENSVEYDPELYHFHFNSTQLYEDFYEAVENAIKNGLSSLEEILLSKFPTDQDEIKSEVAHLRDFYLHQSREPLLKFKETAKEIFALPPNVLLPGQMEDKVVTSEEIAQLKKEADDLEQQYIREVHYRARLKAEIKKFEHVEPLYKVTNEILQFYKNNKPKPGEKSTHDLMKVLKECEGFYYKKKLDSDKSKAEVTDDFGLFKAE